MLASDEIAAVHAACTSSSDMPATAARRGRAEGTGSELLVELIEQGGHRVGSAPTLRQLRQKIQDLETLEPLVSFLPALKVHLSLAAFLKVRHWLQ